MAYPERSSFVFDLAEEAGFPSREKGLEDVSEDTVAKFRQKYLQLANQRDVALAKYLSNRPNVFRAYIPYTPRVFWVANQIVWYLDEILVLDPIASELTKPTAQDPKRIGREVQSLLKIIGHFRPAIESGYVLFASSQVLPSRPEKVPDGVSKLLGTPELLAELDKTVKFGLVERRDSTGVLRPVFTAGLDTGLVVSAYLKEVTQSASLELLTIGEELPEVTPEQVAKVIGSDPFEKVRDIYPEEVHDTLHSAFVANGAGAFPIFDRSVDGLILSLARTNEPIHGEIVESFNLVLRYLENVPPERLLELRETMPDSFREFRARMCEILLEAKKLDPKEGMQLARIRVEKEVSTSLTKLSSEVEAIGKKSRLLGYGLPVVAATGILGGSILGVGSLESLGLFTLGSLSAAVKSAADHASAMAQIRANPLYFVWKAKRNR